MKWKDDDEVIRRASKRPSNCFYPETMLNIMVIDGTEFGFTSSVWGRDMDRVQRIADRLYHGMGEEGSF